MTDLPATPADNTPAATTPAAPAAPATPAAKETDYKDLALKLAALLVPLLGGVIGTLTYLHVISAPASQFIGTVEVAPFSLPDHYTEESEAQVHKSPLRRAAKQYTITVTNRGTKLADNPRLLMPRGAIYWCHTDDRTSEPELLYHIDQNRIELGSMEIYEGRKLYVWSTEPLVNVNNEVITIAYDGGTKEFMPYVSFSPNWPYFAILGLSCIVMWALTALVVRQLAKRYRFTELITELKETKKVYLSNEKRITESEAAIESEKARRFEYNVKIADLQQTIDALKAEIAEKNALIAAVGNERPQ
jgi:hypothetical protein